MMLQFHNLGCMGTGTIFCTALFVGGLMQFSAGFQEFKRGNTFGYSAFHTYGGFWMALGLIWALADLVPTECKHLSITGNDIGFFLVAFTLYTVIMWIGFMRVHMAMFLTFITLLAGSSVLTWSFSPA